MKQRTKTKIANRVVYTVEALVLFLCITGLILLTTVSWVAALAVVAVVGLVFLWEWVEEHASLG